MSRFLTTQGWLNKFKKEWVETMDIQLSVHPDVLSQMSKFVIN